MLFGTKPKKTKKADNRYLTADSFLCGIKDSNFHSSRNQILSLARLPIPPMPLKPQISARDLEFPVVVGKRNSAAKLLLFFELCKKIRKLFIIFCQMASKLCIDGRLHPLRMWV